MSTNPAQCARIFEQITDTFDPTDYMTNFTNERDPIDPVTWYRAFMDKEEAGYEDD